MKDSVNLTDHFDNLDDFEALLAQAEGNAVSDFEVGFIDGITQNYEKYGENMLFSDRQLYILNKLADK